MHKCDGRFTVDARLQLQASDDAITYTIVPVPSHEKCYPPDDLDLAAYLDRPDRAIFLAYVDGGLAGQIVLRTNWNRLAYVEDIVVDAAYRRRGVGRQLMDRAVEWARRRDLPGIMLETQDNNTAACGLYESCGFRLAGFDRYLYVGLDPATEEVALYWYLRF